MFYHNGQQWRTQTSGVAGDKQRYEDTVSFNFRDREIKSGEE